MNNIFFLIITFVITLLVLGNYSCVKDYTNINYSKINGINELSFAKPCLNSNNIDSFIYYANEFTNILNSSENRILIQDSIQITNVSQNSNMGSLEDYYNWVYITFGISQNITEKFALYYNLVLPLLLQEDIRNHPIADRYYFLLESACIHSNLEFENFNSLLRRSCGFWEVFGNTVGLAASVAGAVTIEAWTLGTGTAAAISLGVSAYSYGSAVAGCF